MMLLLVLLVSTAVTAVNAQNRLYGGSMSFYPKGPFSPLEVELRVKAAATTCNGNLNADDTICISGNCGTVTSQSVAIIDSSSDRCLQELVTTRLLSSNKPFEISFAPNNSNWFYFNWSTPAPIPFTMTSQVDLGIRSDTGEANRPPIPGIIHVLRIHQNCPGTVNFTAFDSDGDRVRCRFAVSPNCGPCQGLPPGFFLDQDNCLLTYNLTGVMRQPVLAFELILEDFPRKQITVSFSDGTSTIIPTSAPLSRIPLDFTVFVDADAPSCCAGEFIPLILSPTPPNGAHLPILVGVPLEIRVRALSRLVSRHSRFLNLQISGPSGIMKSRLSSQEFIITWTPPADQLNRQFPICFIVESETYPNSQSQVAKYQSKLRCVIADVIGLTTTAAPTTTSNTASAATTASTFCRTKPSGLFVNPADPGSFFQCHRMATFLMRCPAGLVFSDVCKCCDWPVVHVPGSRFCEGKPDGLFENELDSNTFHHCSNGITITQQCPGNLVYGDGCTSCEWPY